MDGVMKDFLDIFEHYWDFGYKDKNDVCRNFGATLRTITRWRSGGGVRNIDHQRRLGEFTRMHQKKLDHCRKFGFTKKPKREQKNPYINKSMIELDRRAKKRMEEIRANRKPYNNGFKEIRLEVGKTYVFVHYDIKLKDFLEREKFKVIGESKRFYVVEGKNYKTTILKNNLRSDFYKAVQEVR